jgi:hypothetical protein
MVLFAVHVYLFLATQTHKKPNQSASAAEVASVRRFVQGFYDWYTPKLFNEKVDAELLALKSKSTMFTPELKRALLEDWDASSKNKDEIVGLDFDPFLDSQDPDRHYTARQVEPKGKTWLVSVFGSTSSHEKTTRADVIAQVEKTKHGWRFTNFVYGKEDDLLKTLRELKKERDHHS